MSPIRTSARRVGDRRRVSASRPRFAVAVALATVLCVAMPRAAFADSRVFSPVADAYVSAAAPTTNFGGASVLEMDATPTVRSYLRFNVQLPVGATVTGATLRLYSTSTSPVAGFQAYAVPNTTWGEATITYGNAPALGSWLAASGAWSAPGWTSAVLPASAVRNGLVSMAVTTTSTYLKFFYSREGTYRPTLTVSYSVPTSTASAPLVPASGALLGAIHRDPPTASWSQSGFTAFETMVGRKMSIDHRFEDWASTSWPGTNEQWDVTNGRVPMISWGGPSFPGLDAINSGSQDAYIAGVADRVKAFGKPFFLRPMWEMNGDWMRWGGPRNNSSGQTDGPAKYRQAWRRMHDIFVSRGATNAVWAWVPNCNSVPNTTWNAWTNYYPGDSYVDWVGCDGYNWGTTRTWSKWTPWASIFGTTPSVYSDYLRKPFMVAETGSCEQGGDKGAWFRQLDADIKSAFPNVKAFVYFDIFKEVQYNCNWAVNSSAGALAGFKTIAADPYFK